MSNKKWLEIGDIVKVKFEHKHTGIIIGELVDVSQGSPENKTEYCIKDNEGAIHQVMSYSCMSQII